MACCVYKSCQQVSRKLSKISNDLHNILNEIHTSKKSSSYNRKSSKLPGGLQPGGGALSDWYVRPMHLSSTTSYQSRDPVVKSKESESSKNYIPGTVGSIIADIRKDMERQKLVEPQEQPETRRTGLSGDYKSKPVFIEPGKDRDAHLEDYIDETDIQNLDIYGTDVDDQLMETIQTKLSDPNDPIVSPFYAKLAQLRMEELLLEEERLLELKRIQELIRTRRPRKYWYMIRSKEFTEELMRNTDMVCNESCQAAIDQYRTNLIKASLKTGKIFWKPLVEDCTH